MNKKIVTMIGLSILTLGWSGPALGQGEFENRATWQIPSAPDIKKSIDQWLSDRELTELERQQLATLWPADEELELSGSELLDRTVTTIAIFEPRAREVIQFCEKPRQSVVLPEFELLEDPEVAPLVRNNLRLLFSRWLAQNAFYDEAMLALEGLDVDAVVDPASLLFYQSTGHHRLLEKDKMQPLLSKLLEREQEIPRRYATVAKLMAADLQPLKTDSLDEVSRLMDEVRRRLGLYRAGTRVRKQEDDVIAKLDKLIEEMEKQQQQQQGGGAGGGSSRSSSPAQDSNIMGGRGPGDVDPKKIGTKSGWGNLPPKQREEALQQISQELPSHYREVIEEYFRRLALETDR